MSLTFQCYKCNRVLPAFERTGCLVGYALDDNGKYCYDCLTQIEVETMVFQRNIILYLVNKTNIAPKMYVHNYFKTLTLPVDKVKSGPHNLCGFQIHVRFRGPNGEVWSGRNVGDNQILYCHKLKRQRKKLIPPINFLTKYKYL